MDVDDSENITIGIIGEGPTRDLFIEYLLKKEISIHLLGSNVNPYDGISNIYYHKFLSSLVRNSSIIITIMSDGPALERILFDEEGISNYLAQGNVIIDMSSVFTRN